MKRFKKYIPVALRVCLFLAGVLTGYLWNYSEVKAQEELLESATEILAEDFDPNDPKYYDYLDKAYQLDLINQ